MRSRIARPDRRANQRPSSAYYLERALTSGGRRAPGRADNRLRRLDPDRLDRELLAPADVIVLDHPGKLAGESARLLVSLLRRGRGPLLANVSMMPAVPNGAPRFVEQSHGQGAGFLGRQHEPLVLHADPARTKTLLNAVDDAHRAFDSRDNAGDKAFGVLRGAAEALVGLLPAGRRPPALMMSLHVWSMAHGIASLFGRGDSGRRSLPMSAEELLESEMLIYLQGLGFPQK